MKEEEVVTEAIIITITITINNTITTRVETTKETVTIEEETKTPINQKMKTTKNNNKTLMMNGT
jgi:hypothetical protein